MTAYTTGQIARRTGVHANTVRLYEAIGFITKPARLSNGYRVYTLLHVRQIELARVALRSEVLLNGLRKKAIRVVRCCAARDSDGAIQAARAYILAIEREQAHAQAALQSVEALLAGRIPASGTMRSRKSAAETLDISVDTLRNWERNGLIESRHTESGRRMFDEADMLRLRMIRTLRGANYSLSAILRLMYRLNAPNMSVADALNTPDADEEFLSVCDRLLVSLRGARADAEEMLTMLARICKIFV